MKKIAHCALTAAAALALTACGSSTDASDEAMADTVEVPAEEAVAGTPDPVADAAANSEIEANEMDAAEAADAATAAVEGEAATPAVEDAIDAAEDEMQ